MGSVWAMAMKDLRLLSRDYMSLFFIIVFPVGMGLFFGFIGSSFGKEQKGGLQIGVVDQDQSAMSARFIAGLDAIDSLSVEPLTLDVARDCVRRSQLAAYVVLPKGFGESAGIIWAEAPTVEIGVDPSRRAESMMLQGFLMQAMGELVQARFADPQAMRDQVRKTSQETLQDPTLPAANKLALQSLFATVELLFTRMEEANQTSSQTDTNGTHTAALTPKMELLRCNVVAVTAPPTERQTLTRRLRSQWDMSFPSAIMWGVMGCVAGFAVSLARERERGTFLRLSIAPVARLQILAGKGLACFLATLAVVTAMMTLGKVLGIQLNSLPLLILAALCIALSFVGLMMFIAVLGRTEQGVAGAGWALIVILAMFGGGMVPLIFMPPFMKTLSNVSPVKWGVLALEGAIWRGFTFGEMLLPCGVLLSMGSASFVMGWIILNRVRA